MLEGKLPYQVFDFAAKLFADRTGFSHPQMTAFFCHQLNTHPIDLPTPGGINRLGRFKWFLGQFPLDDQRRVLYELCRGEYESAYPWPSGTDRDRLLQMIGGSPITPASMAGKKLDTAFIQEVWRKALDRIHEDPDGAITAARSLLESVCKRILDELGVPYSDKDDLPKLYGTAAKELNLAPSQHTEEVFRKILGGAHAVVDGLANLRNRLGDAHGQGKRSVKPASRHAELAVNMAGSLASFLLATFEYDAGKKGASD
jgi:hypothetical protein